MPQQKAREPERRASSKTSRGYLPRSLVMSSQSTSWTKMISFINFSTFLVSAFAISSYATPVQHSRYSSADHAFAILNVRQVVNGTNTTTCETSTSKFFQNVHNSCESFAVPFQTCPGSPSSIDKLFQLNGGMRQCTLNAFQSSYPCAAHESFQSQDYSPINLAAPLSDPLSINASQTCRYPEYLPIFQEATRYFIDNVDCCGQGYGTGDTSYRYSGEGSGGSNTPIQVIQQTPIQYQRCAIQKAPADIQECVVDTISKLQWISESLFIWGGQSTCKGVSAIFVSMALTMFTDLLTMIFDIWWYRRTGEEKHFSWVKLWWLLVSGFGTPVLTAYLFYRQSFSASMFTLLQIFLLTPKIAPIIGFISPFFIGKSWGVQVLTVDTLLAIASFYTPYTTVRSYTATGGSLSSDGPQAVFLVSLGSLLTAIPGIGVALLYMASGCLMWFFFILGCISKSSTFFGFGFIILLAWLTLIFLFAISPTFALWEIGWKLFAGKERKFEFPPLRWFESAMNSASWVSILFRHVGYWVWCLVQMVVFVGRWMVLANLLPLAGEAFCPSNVKEVAAGSVLFAVGIAACSIGLNVAGLTF